MPCLKRWRTGGADSRAKALWSNNPLMTLNGRRGCLKWERSRKRIPGVGILSDLRDKWTPKATQDTCLIGGTCRTRDPYWVIKRPDLTKLTYQCGAPRYWTPRSAVVCKRCKSMSCLFEGVQNWFALLKMEECSSLRASRVLSKVATFSCLKCCPHIWVLFPPSWVFIVWSSE